MPPINEKRVIDLGCGEGSNTRRFARLGGRMVGIDLSGEFIARARQKEAEDPLGVEYYVGSFGDLACFADGQFDCALSTMALMDGPDFGAAMPGNHRVLKPGGTLCFSVLHPCFVTPAIRWVRDEQGAHLGLQVGRYFDQTPFVERWQFQQAPRPGVGRALRSAALPTHLVRLRQCADRGRLPHRRDGRTAALNWQDKIHGWTDGIGTPRWS